jgi:recombination protein RecA
MSSAVVSTSAALGRPFVFDAKAVPEVSLPAGDNRQDQMGAQESPIVRVLQSTIKNQQSKILPARVTSASQLDIRPAPEMVSSGIPALDTLTGGLPRGCLTEICGPASSGRTTLLLAALAAATQRGEFCAVVDASDALDPQSAAAAGVELDRLLWVRCGDSSPQRHPSTALRACPEPAEGASSATEKTISKNRSSDGCPISRASFAREACPELVEWVGGASQGTFDFDRTNSRQSEHRLEQVLRATDLLLESGGFGLIVLDLGDVPQQAARRIPLTTWFRFRRAVENKPTILLAIEHHPIAGSCSSLLVQLGASNSTVDESTAKQRKNAAHSLPRASRGGASRGLAVEEDEAPEGRKRINLPAQSELDFPYPTHAQLLTGLDITAELIRSRLDRKPARSVMFETKTAWAG